MHSHLKTLRIPYFIVLIGATVYLGMQCLSLKVDEENRSMQSDNSIADELEKEFHRRFNESEPILISVHHENLFGQSGRVFVDSLVSQLRGIEGIEEVASLADRDYTFPDYYEGLMVSSDIKTMGIRVRLSQVGEEKSITPTIDQIETLVRANSYGDGIVRISGLPMQKYEAARLVLKDQKLFAPLSFVVLGAVLLLITLRGSGVLFPLVVAGITTVWTFGIYSLAGFKLNMITSLLAPVILTLSVSTVLHVYLHWLRAGERDKYRRIIDSAKQLYRPCLFATLTTSFGFLSLLLSHTPAVRQFGGFAALGVMLAYLIGFSLLLFGLSIFQPPRNRPGNEIITFSLVKFAMIAIKNPWKVIVVASVIAVSAAVGISKIKVNTDILSFLGDQNTVYQHTMAINNSLTGVSTVEALISKTSEEAFSGLDDLNRIRSFHEWLSELPNVRHVFGMASFLEGIPLSEENSQAALYQVTSDPEARSILEPELKHTRISIRIDPIGTSEGAELIKLIQSGARETLGDNYLLRLSGGFVRVVEESNQMVLSQVKSFGVALSLILISIGIVFRSATFMFLSVIPNLVPLLITGAVMGFFHIDLSTGTAMIAGVVIGVAVDDTIHYLTEFRKRVSTRGCDRAILETSMTSGVALFSTTLALSLGFWVAMLGSFKPTIYFALLSGLTMWLALLCDILVLPAFLKITGKHFTQSNKDERPV